MSKPTENQFQKAAAILGCSVQEVKDAFKKRASVRSSIVQQEGPVDPVATPEQMAAGVAAYKEADNGTDMELVCANIFRAMLKAAPVAVSATGEKIK